MLLIQFEKMKTKMKYRERIRFSIVTKTIAGILLAVLIQANGKSQIDISNFEPATSVEAGHFYNSFSYGAYFYSFIGTGHFANIANYGIGYGIVKQLELKISYSLIHGEWTDFLHLVQLTPKFSSKSGVIGIKGILGLYFRNLEGGRDEKSFETFYRFSPRILFTPYSGRYVDLTFSPMADFLFEKGYTMSYFGLNFGFGFSSNMSVWSIRPEIGFMFDTT